MAKFKQFSYSKTSDEIEFMQGLINLICADGDITCEDASGNLTTAALQYADLTSSSRATFYFNFGDGYRFSLSRKNTNNTGSNQFYINGNFNNSYGPFCSRDDYSVNTVAERIYNLKFIKSDKLFYLGIGDFNNSTPRCVIFHYNDTHNEFHGVSQSGQDLISVTFSSVNDSAALVFPSVLSYSAAAGNIDFIDHTPMISSGIKQFDAGEIYSCSTVSQFSSIALPNGKTYYAIGTHFMVEVEADES